jgi:hypothetical protein
VVEAVLPVDRIVGVAVDVPDVGDTIFLKVGVHALADADQAVLPPAREKEQLPTDFDS